MPNWCSNILTIAGTEERIREVISLLETPYETHYVTLKTNGNIGVEDGVKTGPLLFWNMLSPEDPDAYWNIGGDFQKHGRGLLDWNTENWGTKWDLGEDTHREVTPTEVDYTFDTAWGPPLGAVNAFAANNPDLLIRLSYDEPGMDFAGIFEWKGGVVVDQVEGTSRNRFCSICEEGYHLDWDDEDERCPEWQEAAPGSWSERIHTVADWAASPQELDAIARVASVDADDEHSDEDIQVLIVNASDVLRETLIYLAVHGVSDRVKAKAVRSFTAEDIAEFNASGDPDLTALASTILVARAAD